MTAGLSLRPVVMAEDRALLLAVYASSREAEMASVAWTGAEKSAFLEQQFDLQDRHYRTAFEGAEFNILQVEGTDAGRVIIHRGPQVIELMDLTLLPPWRNQGIGTQITRALMDEASASRRCLRLWVEQFNPARRLYERLGFAHAGNYGVHMEMEFRPPDDQPKTAS